MNNIIILPGYIYLALLVSLMILSLSVVIIGVVLRKILYYIQMTGIDVCDSKVVTRYAKNQVLDKIKRDSQSNTTRLVYIKGQLDRVLNGQTNLRHLVKDTKEAVDESNRVVITGKPIKPEVIVE